MKAFIFDLDGVLVDACEWHRLALNKALKEVCNFEISVKDHHAEYNGIPTRVKLEKLTRIGKLHNNDHEVVYNLKQKYTIELIKEKASVRKEKIYLIEKLKSEGYIVCCFTNSIKKTAMLMLEKTGIADLFDTILTNQDVKNPKPSPEGYNKIVDMYNLKKENVYIVEDSPKGVKSAQDSECNVIIVNNPEDVYYSKLKEYIK